MSNDDVINKVTNIINKFLDEAIDIYDNFQEVGMNSIIFIEIIVEIEKEFDIEFENKYLDMGLFKDAEALIEYVKHIMIDDK